MRLKALKSFYRACSDLTPEDRVKIKSTDAYSLRQDPDQDKTDVINRCAIAQLAEKAVADWMDGYVAGGQENHDDPYTYAWDVLAHPRFCGLRVEVKTHQSDSKWISVTTGYSGDYPGGSGINLGPFLTHRVADCIIILDVVESGPSVYQFTLKFAGDHEDLKSVVRKSNYQGWYLNL
ncbi:endonuclease [Enterobacter phage vB-EclM_KMB19]|nr:endonuclease [Enterobacter phage vB-EclM_KMB19]